LSDELGASVSDLVATDLASMPLDELVGWGDSPLAHLLRRRRDEIDHPDTTVASHDSSIN
jgi:hypothetical protein